CLYLGCLQAGGVYLPLNPAYTDQEVAYFLNDAEPTLLVCDPTRTQGLTKPAKTCGISDIWTLSTIGPGTACDAAHACSNAFDPVPRSADDMVGVLYTSGTTGRSKGAMISARNLLSNALALKACWRFTSDDVLLHALPIFHTHGLFVATHTIMAAGASMIFQPKFDVDDVFTALPNATTLMGVPTFYTRLLADPRLDKTSVSNMRLFVSGSAPLSAQTHKAFAERTGHAILERYGMTETNMITTNPYEGERRPGSVGFALPGVEVRVSNPVTGAALPRGETGVIEIRGPNVFSGYWRMPDKTETEFRQDGFFISGDLGYFDEDGYLALVGRSKDLIISGGFNVYPAEVETILNDIKGVMESAVIGVPHPDLGECVAAVIVLKRDVELAAA
ncbi:MAG: AMP-binding protein, partial [Pseudomonadota bacterium]